MQPPPLSCQEAADRRNPVTRTTSEDYDGDNPLADDAHSRHANHQVSRRSSTEEES